MKMLNTFNKAIKKYYLYLLSPLVFFYIGFHLINGNNGLLAHVHLNDQIKSLEHEIKLISKDSQTMLIKITQLEKDTYTDIQDEMLRKVLNFSQDNEYIIIFN
jgi:cell division protein FtsB|tara:strand:+ start:1246 stop:1554 length:309 start_codon:yes stop_codon:yes gene_type:complete